MSGKRLVSRKDVAKGCTRMPSPKVQAELFDRSTRAYRAGDRVGAIRLSAAARDRKAARRALREAS